MEGWELGINTYLNLEKVLGWSIDLFEALLTGVRDGLHRDGIGGRGWSPVTGLGWVRSCKVAELYHGNANRGD